MQVWEVAMAGVARRQESQGSEIGVQQCLLPVQVNLSPGEWRPQAQGHMQEVTAGKYRPLVLRVIKCRWGRRETFLKRLLSVTRRVLLFIIGALLA